jgi:hypothetical protein
MDLFERERDGRRFLSLGYCGRFLFVCVLTFENAPNVDDLLLQIRHRFGCYDEITEVDGHRVRHCNWVRFLRAATAYNEDVNVIGTKVKGIKE